MVRVGVGVVAGVATLVGAVGVALHFSPSWSRPVVLAASGAPYLMGAALVGVAGFAAVRSRVGAAVAVVVVVVALWTLAPLGRAGLDRLLPHRFLAPGRNAAGTGIWSAYPLSDTVEYDGFVLNQLSATATLPDVGPVTVYAFHPVPPVFGTRVWGDELARLRAILGRSPDRPAIVGGDFNATYDHSQFRSFLSGRFADATEQVGAGLLLTYPTDKRWPPLIGIDHILVAGGRAVAADTVSLPGADHRALVARIRW